MNDDTISRKATIDAVHTATYRFICGAEDGDEMTDADKLVLSINKAVVNAIKELPSVQPDIIRCKDCKYCEHWYADKGRCFLWHEGGIDVFEEGFCNYAERRDNE